MPDTAVRPDPTRERQAALTEAGRAWRRAGVRATHQRTRSRTSSPRRAITSSTRCAYRSARPGASQSTPPSGS